MCSSFELGESCVARTVQSGLKSAPTAASKHSGRTPSALREVFVPRRVLREAPVQRRCVEGKVSEIAVGTSADRTQS